MRLWVSKKIMISGIKKKKQKHNFNNYIIIDKIKKSGSIFYTYSNALHMHIIYTHFVIYVLHTCVLSQKKLNSIKEKVQTKRTVHVDRGGRTRGAQACSWSWIPARGALFSL